MNKVRNRRNNACKVLSKQLTQSKKSVDGELGTLASWTGHQGRHNIGPCSVNPQGPLGWVRSTGSAGTWAPSRHLYGGEKIFIWARELGFSSYVGGRGWGGELGQTLQEAAMSPVSGEGRRSAHILLIRLLIVNQQMEE